MSHQPPMPEPLHGAAVSQLAGNLAQIVCVIEARPAHRLQINRTELELQIKMFRQNQTSLAGVTLSGVLRKMLSRRYFDHFESGSVVQIKFPISPTDEPRIEHTAERDQRAQVEQRRIVKSVPFLGRMLK